MLCRKFELIPSSNSGVMGTKSSKSPKLQLLLHTVYVYFIAELSFSIGPPVPCVKVPRAYPKDPRESSPSPERVPYSPQDNVQYSPNEKRPNDNGLYPQLPGNVNEIGPYGGYAAPTRPRQSPGAGEKTPLLP